MLDGAAPSAWLQQRSLLGRSCLLFSGIEPSRSLALSDALLQRGAAVELIVPLPASGEATADEGSLRLMQRIQRFGFSHLMEELGYRDCQPSALRMDLGGATNVAVQRYAGNRRRISWSHLRSDDIEALHLALLDHDLLIIHADHPDGLSEIEQRAHWRMRRALHQRMIVPALTRRGVRLCRDHSQERVRFAWLREQD